MDYNIGYSCDGSSPNCKMQGLIFDENLIQEKFPTEVKDRLVDQEGSDRLKDRLSKIAKTGFEKKRIEEICTPKEKDYEPWQIGEAFSEYFLEQEKGVRFWSHTMRDLKNPDSSPAGTDIVGFVDLGDETIFVFGEVKTSNQEKYPPGLLTGRSGMKKQIKDLSKDNEVKDDLVKYLGHKIVDLPEDHGFSIDYDRASMSYLKEKVHLFGLLVRDVDCNELDLRARYNEYKDDLSEFAILDFIGLYVPIKIEKWNEIIKGN